jgi:NADH-quinone oxidoreductase subunit J
MSAPTQDFIQTTLPIALYVMFCTFAVVSALGVVILRNPVSSAFSLIIAFLNVACIFAMQGAYFISAVQVIIYAGAIMVLFIFVIMLLSIERVEMDFPTNKAFLPIPIAVGTAFFLGMGYILSKSAIGQNRGPFTLEAIEASGGNVRVISELMFSDYVLPFLIMGMLLSISIVGAVLLAKKRVE